MTSAPGWYPDPADPAGVRWFDGQAWTEHTQRPAPAFAQAQPAWPPTPVAGGTGNRAAIIALTVIIAIFITGILAAIAIPVFLNQRAKASVSALSAVTCESIGAEAVTTSQAQVAGGTGVPLSSVSGLVVSQDNRATVSRPTPGSQSFVLSCIGTALWQDGVSTPVQVNLHIDSAVQHVVSLTWDE